MYHVPAGSACAVSALCTLTSYGRKALLGSVVMRGGKKGDPLGLWIKMLKFELAKYSSLFSGETMPMYLGKMLVVAAAIPVEGAWKTSHDTGKAPPQA